MSIEVHEKFYLVTHNDGFVEVVRRESKFTSGWKSQAHIKRTNEIENILEAK